MRQFTEFSNKKYRSNKARDPFAIQRGFTQASCHVAFKKIEIEPTKKTALLNQIQIILFNFV
jgi:hypothetical protein